MPHEGQRQLVSRYACTVVADPDRGLARSADVDVDTSRLGIECVLDQLLDQRVGLEVFELFAQRVRCELDRQTELKLRRLQGPLPFQLREHLASPRDDA